MIKSFVDLDNRYGQYLLRDSEGLGVHTEVARAGERSVRPSIADRSVRPSLGSNGPNMEVTIERGFVLLGDRIKSSTHEFSSAAAFVACIAVTHGLILSLIVGASWWVAPYAPSAVKAKWLDLRSQRSAALRGLEDLKRMFTEYHTVKAIFAFLKDQPVTKILGQRTLNEGVATLWHQVDSAREWNVTHFQAEANRFCVDHNCPREFVDLAQMDFEKCCFEKVPAYSDTSADDRWDYTGTDFEHTPNIVLSRSSGASAIDQHVANNAAPLAAETVLAQYRNRAYQSWADFSKARRRYLLDEEELELDALKAQADAAK